MNYFNSTLAPAPSNVAFIFSASSLATASLTVFGADSTNALASPRPKPVISFTALITANLFAPTSDRTTSNSVFSSAAAAAGPAATATAAAALTLDWGDGLLYDRAAAWQEYRQMVLDGMLRPELALAWYFGLPHETEQELAAVRARCMPAAPAAKGGGTA